jgi:dTDP-4-amino-4,6-dideoxygalactose transaminase
LLLGRGKKELGALRKTSGNEMREIFLPDLNAALGLTQIKSIERFVERRKEIAAIFSRAVMQSRHKMLIQKNEGENVFYSFPVLLGSGIKDVQSYTRKKNIDTRPAFADSIMTLLEDRERDLPIAKSLFLRCLLFPLYPTLTKSSITLIEKVLSTLP